MVIFDTRGYSIQDIFSRLVDYVSQEGSVFCVVRDMDTMMYFPYRDLVTGEPIEHFLEESKYVPWGCVDIFYHPFADAGTLYQEYYNIGGDTTWDIIKLEDLVE